MALTRAERAIRVDLYHEDDFALGATGDITLVSGQDNLRQAIYHRLVTVKGSLAHRPDYGVGLKNYLGAPLTPNTQLEIMREIQDQFTREERIDALTGLEFAERDGAVIIKLSYRPRGGAERQESFEISG